MDDRFGILRFASIEDDLRELKAKRKVKATIVNESQGVDILLDFVEQTQRLHSDVRSHSDNVESLERNIELGKTLWSELWAYLVGPSVKKRQDEIAQLLKQALKRASDLITIAGSQDRTEIELVKRPFAAEDTSERLAVTSIRASLMQSRARKQSQAPKHRNRFVSNDLRHIVIALIAFTVLSLVSLFTKRSLPVAVVQGARVIAWYAVLLWFPVYFLEAIPTRRYQLTTATWATFFLWLAYGFIAGTAYSILLFAFPMRRLLHEPAYGSLDTITTSYSTVASVGLFLVFVLSHEPLWLFGLTIWLGFAFILAVSRRYYRKLDQVEVISTQRPSRVVRHRILLVGYVFTLALFSPGVFGLLAPGSEQGLLELLTTLLVTFITLVFAIQAIVPGITAWESDDPRAALREQRTVLQTIEGLRGFLISGGIALVSVVGLRLLIQHPNFSFGTERYFDEVYHAGDLVFNRVGTTISLGFTLGMLGQFALVFAIAVSVQVLAQLYYLFIAGNTLLSPLRAKVRTTPVILPDARECRPDYLDDIERAVWNKVEASLRAWDFVRGKIVSNLQVNHSTELGGSLYVLVEFWDDFPVREEVCDLAQRVCDRLFRLDNQIGAIRIVVRTPFPGIGETRAFLGELNRDTWNTVFPASQSLPIEYLWKELGASIHGGVFEDSYAA